MEWQGWVEDVDDTLSGYELWVDMDAPDDSLSGLDVSFDIPDEIALKIMKDQRVVFSGSIRRASEFLGSVSLELEDVVFELP